MSSKMKSVIGISLVEGEGSYLEQGQLIPLVYKQVVNVER